MLLKQLARSTTSGSFAAFVNVVTPSARQAAINKFSVPVTVTVSKTISAPLRPEAVARIYPPSTSILAPMDVSACKCMSTGRVPIAQPPGRETSACPKRANKGPSTRIEARIVFTNSYGAKNFEMVVLSTSTSK